MKTRICHLTSVHHVTDPRIFLKECVSLARAGYEVFLVAPHFREETVDGVHIIPFKRFDNRFLRMLCSPFLMLKSALKLRAEMYHLHDPELQIAGFLLKLLGRRVVFDSHEMVLMDLGDKYYLKNGVMKRLIPAVYRLVEALAVRCLDGYVLAEDGYREYFFAKYRRYSHKFVFLRNYPALRLIDSVSPASREDGTFVAVYAGKLSWNRGIKELIQVAEIMKGAIEVNLIGQWENDALERECRALPGWRYVRFLGFLPPQDVYGHMKASDIGVCNLYPVSNYMVSLPVKALEYMACGLPMVMSDFPVWRRMFTSGAVFVDPLDVDAIAGTITRLMQDGDMLASLKARGRRLVETEMSWEIEEKKLMEMYDKIVKRPGNGAAGVDDG